MKQVLHVDLFVSSVERSLEFYVGVLGCTVVDDATVELPSMMILTRGLTDRVRIVMLRTPGTEGTNMPMIELMELKPESGAKLPVRFGTSDGLLPSLGCFSILVYDLEEVVGELAEAGISTVTPIEVVTLPRLGASRTVYLHDPDGNLIELVDVPK